MYLSLVIYCCFKYLQLIDTKATPETDDVGYSPLPQAARTADQHSGLFINSSWLMTQGYIQSF